MNILNKPINTLKFEDVVALCENGYPEGVQIDYKRNFPTKGFAKHLASFSNTRGGVIIIGVEEDKKSGVPVACEGIVKDARQIERIHQEAGNVEPIPLYEVYATEEVEGKCFILIRINEGDKTPYYVQNDSNVWTRTGNISNSIDIASPDGLELLFGRKEKAERARNLYLKMAHEVYTAGLEREEKKRQKEVQEAERKAEKNDFYSKNKLGTNVIICRIVVQPYFPQKSLSNPREIKTKLGELSFRSGHDEFPNINMTAMPDGLFYFFHGFDGYIECQQIFGHGLIYNAFDVLSVNKEGKRQLYIGSIAKRLFVLLQFVKNLYSHFGYQGVIDGFISLNDMKDVYICELNQSELFRDADKENLLANYEWKLNLDTNILNNKKILKEYYFSLIREIYWSLGYANVRDEIIDAYLNKII